MTAEALDIALLVGMGVAAQWAADRLRIAAILPLLVLGYVVGPVLGWLDPDRLFGDLLFVGVSLGVGIILFEGALTLDFRRLEGGGTLVLRLVTLGFAVSAAVLAAASHLLLGFPPLLALLFGAIASVSGPTVIIPLLKAVRPKEKLAEILRWEGILIDPIGAVAAVILFESLIASQTVTGERAWWFTLIQVLGVGTAFGIAVGIGFGALLRRHAIPDYLHNVAALAVVLLTFALANHFAHESGLVAVTVLGITLANMREVPKEGILDFKESLSILLISLLFILLAARMDMRGFAAIGPLALVGMGVAVVLSRPLAVWVAALGAPLAAPEKLVLASIAPRGIIAAAVSALFALRLEELGIPGAGLFAPLVFAVIVGSVLLYSLAARPVARALGQTEPEDHGALVIGANPAAIAIAAHFHELGLPVIVADQDWRAIREARLKGLRTFFGHPVSEQADRQLDLVGIGMLLALSRDASLNLLACLRYKGEFGSRHVFMARPDRAAEGGELSASVELRGRLLFAPGWTIERLNALLEHGGAIIRHELAEGEEADSVLARCGGPDRLLFVVERAGSIRPVAEKLAPKPAAGDWLIIACDPEPAEDASGGKRSGAAGAA
ncbi:MAG: sodium/hydrogen antiporter [Rhodothalassiaceae bacterium]|nr:MAG: sodium/hydrogen antiporter [Rhodothalassiaceae bacterium]